MASYPNQKDIEIEREVVDLKSGIPFLQIYCDNIETAARELNSCALKLYLYLCSNKNGYVKQFSPRHFQIAYGVSINSARTSFQELMNKGYIEHIKDSRYKFNEVARKQGRFTPEVREIIDEDGLAQNLTYDQLKEQAKGCNEMTINYYWNKGKVVGGNN